MNTKVELPDNALPLDTQVLEKVQGFESRELYWLSGYCSGLADARAAENYPVQSIAQEKPIPVALQTLVLYASQTGNAEKVAESLHHLIEDTGMTVTLASVGEFKPANLKKFNRIFIVASTHGEGEPPDDALEFYEYIQGKRAPKLDGVKYAVLGLGDSSYEFFCQTAKDIDKALTKLGAEALVPRVDCDLDFAAPSAKWAGDIVEQLLAAEPPNNASGVRQADADQQPTVAGLEPGLSYDKNRPFQATILESQRITARDSVKHVQHIELSIEGSGLDYLPGDSLGVWPTNSTETVSRILDAAGLTGDESIDIGGDSTSLELALTHRLEITLLNKAQVESYADYSDSSLLKNAVQDFGTFKRKHQFLDLLQLAPNKLEPQQLADWLKPIKPRMYSIASSLIANPDEVHITVALEHADNDRGRRFGAASQYLIETLQAGEEVAVFVEPNKHFKLPVDDRPVVMIGPGTGVAPFRAFLQEREEREASGENWLFFGNPNFNSDFLYQLEIQTYLKQGLLKHLSLAFSRDQAEKIYVQDRLSEEAEVLWDWLENKKAHIYICGDMSNMAKAVEQTLLEIIQKQGAMTAEKATGYLKQLKREKRYQRDVY